MAYKKFHYRGGKKYGPYYYESYRKDGKVKRKYIGDKKEYEEWRKVKCGGKLADSHLKNTLKNSGRFFIFGLIALVVLGLGFAFIFSGFVKQAGFTGFSISENMSEMEKQAVLYENEIVSEEMNTSSVVLEVREPLSVSGEILNKNKNKRMDFEMKDGKIRLYFDLLNYSEFVENVVEASLDSNESEDLEFAEENLTEEINLTKEVNVTVETNLTLETNITLETNVSEVNITANISVPEVNLTANLTVPEANATSESIVNETDVSSEAGNNISEEKEKEKESVEKNIGENEPVPEEETKETKEEKKELKEEKKEDKQEEKQETKEKGKANEEQETVGSSEPATEAGISQPAEQPAGISQPASEQAGISQPASEQAGITGNIIRFFKITGKVIGGFFSSILSITARAVVGETNLSQDNFSNDNLTEVINQSKEQEPVTETIAVDLEEVKNKLDEMDKEEIESISDSAVVDAEDLEIVSSVLNNSKTSEFAGEPEGFKWGYKVRLNDLKFMAKIEVTSEQAVSVYDIDTLKIGRNLLSFKDLSNAGYKISFETPALEMDAGNISVENRNVVTNITDENEISNVSNENEIVNNNSVNEETSNNESINEEGNNINNEIDNQTQSIINETPKTENAAITNPEGTGSGITSSGITGNIIKFFGGMTAKVIDTLSPSSLDNGTSTIVVEEIEYANSITVYIEKDMASSASSDAENSTFTASQVDFEDVNGDGVLSIGDIINLDPTLIIIPATDAEHLDTNRSFVSNIYDSIKTLDNNWSEIIPTDDYVRVTFSEALDRTKDITIFARARNISGECYDNETHILTENGWKYFYELNGSEKVMTLNSKTGEKEWQLPSSYQEFDNSEINNEMYNIQLVDGNELLVSEKHRVYASSEISNLSVYNVIKLPSKSSGFVFLSSSENDSNNSFGLSCGIFNQTTEKILPLGNFEESEKCLSFDMRILCSNLENSASVPLESSFGLNTTSNPFCFRNFNNSFFTFSSNKNFILCWNQFEFSFSKFCSKLQGCFDMLFFKGNEKIVQDFFYGNTIFKQFKNLPDHDSCTFECRSTSTNLTICNDIMVDFNSHNFDSIKQDLNNYRLQKISEIYSSLQSGNKIYFLDENGGKVRVKNITKEKYSGKIYDVDVSNDIVLVKRKNGNAIWSGNSNPDSVEISVFRKDSNEEIARFENITSEGWHKIYLDGLNETESYETFDLRVLNAENVLVNNSVNINVNINGQEVSYDIYQKKKRIDELRRLLNQG